MNTRRNKTSHRDRRYLKWILSGLGIVIATVMLAVGTVAVLVFKQQSLPVVEAKAPAIVQSKIEQIQSAATSEQHRVVRLDEEEVNSIIRSRLQVSSTRLPVNAVSFRDARVHLIGDHVKAYVVLGVQANNMTVEIEGKLYSRQGLLRLEPTSGGIGALPIPQSALTDAVQQIMDSPDGQQRLRLKGNLSDLRIENSQVVLTYN